MERRVSSEAYGAFAYAYDRALGERFFAAARRMIDAALRKHPTAKRTHLDLACGTGLAIADFARRGWTSTGIDASVEMLDIARQRASRLVAGDLRALPLRGTFARITCLYDSLNHLLDPNDLAAAFQSVSALMDADSLFFFDMNHPDIYPAVWGFAEPFVAAGRDYRLEIATTYRKREKFGRAHVTGWAKIGERKIAIDEQHLQRAYSEREIHKALDAARLEAVDVIDFDPYGEAEAVDAPTVKLFFVCRKK